MTPAAALAMLARQLQNGGETVTLRRYTGPPSAPLSTYGDTELVAKVRPVTPEEIASGIDASRRRVVLSPADAGIDAVAVNKDAILIDGGKFTIVSWSPVRIGTTPVRIDAEIA